MATTKAHRPQGGKKFVVEDGGAFEVKDGGGIEMGTGVTMAVIGTNVVISGLPTSDPAVAGALWSNAGVLNISAG